MSLDVYLTKSNHRKEPGSGIFLRENGQTRELTWEEWDERFPGKEPVVVRASEDDEAYSSNITHNLGKMAAAAGIYEALWRPEEIGITTAAQLIEPLKAGLAKLQASPEEYKKHNAPNGWGMYEHFVPFVRDYLQACMDYPDATVRVSR